MIRIIPNAQAIRVLLFSFNNGSRVGVRHLVIPAWRIDSFEHTTPITMELFEPHKHVWCYEHAFEDGVTYIFPSGASFLTRDSARAHARALLQQRAEAGVDG